MPKEAVQTDTRSRAINAALSLFADKGFYGVSMDHIARELDLTKQALIHHFGTKEKLYGAVLNEISDRLLEGVSDASKRDGEAFADAVLRIYERTQLNTPETQLLMRELLDNRRRAAQAGTWYLRPFLDGLDGLLRKSEGWGKADTHVRAAHIYQIMGAINYFSVSADTLEDMYSPRHVQRMRKVFPSQLRRLAEAPPC